jgi:hypothetical protein
MAQARSPQHGHAGSPFYHRPDGEGIYQQVLPDEVMGKPSKPTVLIDCGFLVWFAGCNLDNYTLKPMIYALFLAHLSTYGPQNYKDMIIPAQIVLCVYLVYKLFNRN